MNGRHAETKRFRAERVLNNSVEVIQLHDAEADLSVYIAPSHGNIAYSLMHKGGEWLWTPFADPPSEMEQSKALFGIPLLSPWANRLSSDSYSIHGVEYTLNRRIPNLRVDHNYLPIHGLVMFAPWTVTAIGTDSSGAYLRSILNFTRRSDWMAQFPFAHRLELTHRISEGRLSVFLSFTNDSAVSVPLCIGFHPYFKLPGTRRDSWRIQSAASKLMCLSDRHIPTGKTETLDAHVPMSLTDGFALDDVYTDLKRDELGYARFSVEDGARRLSVGFGSKYPVTVIYAPPDRDFVCLEPMAAPTDAFHLEQAGLCDPLQYVAPGETWTEHFWIKPEVL